MSILLHEDSPVYSLEAVEHQPAGKYTEIENEFERLMNKSLVSSKDLANLASLTYKHFGIQVNIKVISDVNAYAQLLVLNDRSPLFSVPHNKIIKEYVENGYDLIGDVERSGIITLKNPNEGFVDIKNAKVGGVFSTYVLDSGIGINAFKEAGFTHLEVMAIYLHEIGHVFTSFSYSSQLHRFNQVLELTRQKNLKSFEEVKTYFINESKKQGLLSKEDIQKLNNAKTHVGLCYDVANILVAGSINQLPQQILSNNTGEQLADMFASRLGYGGHLASALNKMSSVGQDTFAHNTLFLIIAIIFSSAVVGIALFAALLSVAAFLVGFMIALIYQLVASVVFGGLQNKENNYDTIKRRLIRIKQQLIDYLKVNQNNISRTDYQIYYNKITALDGLIKYKGDSLTNIFDLLAGVFNGDHKKAQDGMKFEQAMEDLLYSDLYISRTNLKTLIA